MKSRKPFCSTVVVLSLLTVLSLILALVLQQSQTLSQYAQSYREFVAGGKVPIDLLESTDLTGKIIVITGGNSGIGFESARVFYRLGAHVILLCRDEQKTKRAVQQIAQDENNRNNHSTRKLRNATIEYMIMDLADLDSVVKCANTINQRGLNISVLLNNAGQMMPPHNVTKQGFEVQFGVNYLGHFLLTHKLMDNLLRNNARIINTGSIAHSFYWFTNPFRSQYIHYDSVKGDGRNWFKVDLYSQSKWAMMLFTRELQRRIQSHGSSKATTYSLHPGCVLTELPRHVPTILMIPTRLTKWFILKEPYEGAQTSIFLSVKPGIEENAGEYFADCKVSKATFATYDTEPAKELWKRTVEMLGDYYEKK